VELVALQPLHQFLEQLPYTLVVEEVAQVQLAVQQEQAVLGLAAVVVALALVQQLIQVLAAVAVVAYLEVLNQLVDQADQAS
jgi:hypothetical protein